MATATAKKRRNASAKAKPEADKSELLRKAVMDWHSVSYGLLDGILNVATDMYDELVDDADSPLHNFVDRSTIHEFIEDLDEARCTMLNLFGPFVPAAQAIVPNPTDLLK